jgi:hypothetical protein
MSSKLTNLTLPVIMQEIEDVLYEYPEHPYQSAFSIPELRQKLIAHLLNHVPNRYAAEGLPASSSPTRSSPLQERLRLEMVVRGSILHILRENADWLNRHLPNA